MVILVFPMQFLEAAPLLFGVFFPWLPLFHIPQVLKAKYMTPILHLHPYLKTPETKTRHFTHKI